MKEKTKKPKFVGRKKKVNENIKKSEFLLKKRKGKKDIQYSEWFPEKKKENNSPPLTLSPPALIFVKFVLSDQLQNKFDYFDIHSKEIRVT